MASDRRDGAGREAADAALPGDAGSSGRRPDTTLDGAAPKGWSRWYRFARDELGFLHDECVEYANLRFVEEQNRATLRAHGQDGVSQRGVRTRPDVRPD
jgi:hypothetical protein